MDASASPETTTAVDPQTVELSAEQLKYLADLQAGNTALIVALLLVCIFLLAAISVRSMG